MENSNSINKCNYGELLIYGYLHNHSINPRDIATILIKYVMNTNLKYIWYPNSSITNLKFFHIGDIVELVDDEIGIITNFATHENVNIEKSKILIDSTIHYTNQPCIDIEKISRSTTYEHGDSINSNKNKFCITSPEIKSVVLSTKEYEHARMKGIRRCRQRLREIELLKLKHNNGVLLNKRQLHKIEEEHVYSRTIKSYENRTFKLSEVSN